MLVPRYVISFGFGICNNRVVARPIDAADLSGGVYWDLAQFALRILIKDFVKVRVVDVVQTNESGENVRSKVLQDVELITC